MSRALPPELNTQGRQFSPPVGGSLDIADVRFISVPPGQEHGGLVGWISCTLNHDFRLDGIALRHTVDGRLTLSFPARRDASGRQHFFIRPLDDRARREIERQVFSALGFEEEAPR